MNFDLDTNNYTKDDYMDIFNLDKSMNPYKKIQWKKIIKIY